MRPKKIVVIIDPHEHRQGVTRYALWVNGYHAIGVPSLYAAREVAAEAEAAYCGLDLFLGYWPVDEALFAQLGKDVGIPAIFMSSTNGTAHNLADATLDAVATPMAELIERVKVLSRRKRGPVKGTPSPLRKIPPLIVAPDPEVNHARA